MEKTYTEKELQELLERSGNQVNITELDRHKVYIFRICHADEMSRETVMNMAHNLKNVLDRLGIESMVLIDDIISVYELEKN